MGSYVWPGTCALHDLSQESKLSDCGDIWRSLGLFLSNGSPFLNLAELREFCWSYWSTFPAWFEAANLFTLLHRVQLLSELSQQHCLEISRRQHWKIGKNWLFNIVTARRSDFFLIMKGKKKNLVIFHGISSDFHGKILAKKYGNRGNLKKASRRKKLSLVSRKSSFSLERGPV